MENQLTEIDKLRIKAINLYNDSTKDFIIVDKILLDYMGDVIYGITYNKNHLSIIYFNTEKGKKRTLISPLKSIKKLFKSCMKSDSNFRKFVLSNSKKIGFN